jgi:hypothetical protein
MWGVPYHPNVKTAIAVLPFLSKKPLFCVAMMNLHLILLGLGGMKCCCPLLLLLLLMDQTTV